MNLLETKKVKLEQDDIDAFVTKYQTDWVQHIVDLQGVVTLEEYQIRVIKKVMQHERVCISACHDVGKTFMLAKIILAFMSMYPGAKVITTAPTFNQVKRLLWSEIRNGWKKSKHPLGGVMLQTEWKIDDDWFAIGFTSKNEATMGDGQGTSSGFQGFHGEHVMIVFDEATGVPHQVWTQAEGMLTSGSVKFIAIGNPTARNSEFFKCFSSPAWEKIYLSCFDSPNLIANGIKDLKDLRREHERLKEMPEKKAYERLRSYKIVQPKLLSLSWVMQAALKWGIEHPLFISKVLGKFPDEDANVMIPLSIVEQAQLRYENMTHKPNPKPKMRTIGVDPARFGPDMTVITVLEDGVQTLLKRIAKSRTTEVSGEIVNYLKPLPRALTEIIVVDATGIGSGVIDDLKEAQSSKDGLPSSIGVREVHFGAACDSNIETKKKSVKMHYLNVKAKMFDYLSKDIRSTLALMPDNIYLEQLPTILYKFTSKGQLIIESKDDYKKRTGLSSPDESDSLALANYGRYPEMSSGIFVEHSDNSDDGIDEDTPFSGDAW